jgi:type IV secretion system protein VirD4
MASEARSNRGRLLASALLIALFTAAIGYVLASGVVQWWLGQAEPDFAFIVKNYQLLQQYEPRLFNLVNVIILGCFVGGLALASRLISERLTAFGTTHWMTKHELGKKGFHADSRVGFVLGKTSGPKQKGRFIVSGKHPHCLLVAPTGRGKGVGFVIPNLLSYKGSAVVLDVKGENFEATARFREKMGQTVYRFSPRDFDQPSHRYNPLARVGVFANPAKRMAELEKIATLFLQADDASAASFLPNSREVFIACAILAHEQNNLTLGHVYKLAFGGRAPNVKFAEFATLVKDRSAKLLFQKLANTTEKTLSAYLSVLSSAGMSPWANPHTCAVTARTDFDFSTFRKAPQTVYFTVPADDITAIAPLVRLFFSDLIATLQQRLPGRDEPFPVLILLDEFQRIGKMQIIVDSISLLRGYGGNLAIVTQTIPNLDEVYGETSRKALQGGAGIKLYLTPSEEDTVKELSAAVGMTTKRVVSKSRSIGQDGIFGTNVSERTEEHPLLTPDQARRLPDDDVIIVVDADLPIRAKRIQYYDDHAYQELYESQNFEAPLPLPPHTITEADYEYLETDEEVAARRAEVAAEKAEAIARGRAVADGDALGQGQAVLDLRGGIDPGRIGQIAAAIPPAAASVRRTRPRLPLPEAAGAMLPGLSGEALGPNALNALNSIAALKARTEAVLPR